MKRLLVVLFFLLSFAGFSQVVPVDFSPLAPYISKVNKDSASIIVNAGTGVKLLYQKGDSIFAKTFVKGAGIDITDNGTELIFNNLYAAPRGETVLSYSSSFSITTQNLKTDDINVIFTGTVATTATLPIASENNKAVVIIVNKGTAGLTVNGLTIGSRRYAKFVSNGTSWVTILFQSILAGY